MVELYWPRNTTFSLSTESGVEKFRPGLHDVAEDRAEQFKERGWVDPDDDDVDVEIDRGGDDEDTTIVVEDESDEDEDEEIELEEDELALSTEVDDEGDDEDEEFDAEAFVDRTPQKEVIVDLETGEYDEYLDEIETAEAENHDRRGVERALEERRGNSDSDDSDSDES